MLTSCENLIMSWYILTSAIHIINTKYIFNYYFCCYYCYLPFFFFFALGIEYKLPLILSPLKDILESDFIPGILLLQLALGLGELKRQRREAYMIGYSVCSVVEFSSFPVCLNSWSERSGLSPDFCCHEISYTEDWRSRPGNSLYILVSSDDN